MSGEAGGTYRHPQRPDEAGTAVVQNRAEAAIEKADLERAGSAVIKIGRCAASTLPAFAARINRGGQSPHSPSGQNRSSRPLMSWNRPFRMP